MFSRKKLRDGEREKETERGNKTSVPSPAPLRGGVRPASGREETQTPPPEAQCPSEIRLVLLGRKGAGKSSAGNTILGIKEGGFTCGSPTEVCMERWADVAGRRVVIVDTPGWEWYYPLNGTPDWVKWETVRSVTLSQPGPHALLLVVRACASMDGMYLKAIQEHMELLGEGVWKHTLVLFTQDDNPDDSTIEGRIRKGGADFQLLVEKCGNRWHVLNSKARGRDTTQVVELLRKVEQMVAANGGAPLEMEQVHQRLEQEDRGWRPREERRNQRLLEVRKLGESLQEIFAGDGSLVTWREEVEARWPPGRGRRLPDLRVVLLGERETGKTLAGSAILGGVSFQAGRVTEECLSAQAEVAGRWVTVVDTPGWECNRTPERVRHEIRRSVTLCPPGPHALLLVVGVDSDITEQAATEHLGLLGEEAWRYALVLFTGKDKLRRGVTIEQHVQSSGKASQLVKRCEGRYHVINGMEPGNTAQVTRLLEKVEDLVAGNGGQPFTPLTQEIRELVRKKDERCKDVTEMKRKSRWSFERKPKERDKMEGKPEMGREEEEERRQTEMRKLLDKGLKMEIQEAKEKNDRIVAILDQEYKLREGYIKVENELKIEEKEMEIKALKEKNEEIIQNTNTEIVNKNTEIVELNKLNQEKTKELQKREAEIKEKIQKHDLETEELKHRNATKEREFCNLQQTYKEKEREVEELQHRLQEREQHTEVLKQDFEKKQQQREEVWRVENEKMKNQVKETTEMYEKKRKGRDQEIGELRKNYEEKMREINTKNEGKLREQEKEIRNIEGVLREKDKKMEDIKQHYEEELRKTQLEIKLKNEEKESEEERSRQILTEREAQLELNDQRISELMDQAQENEKRAKVTEKRLKDELRKKAEELEQKMKEKEKEVEEMKRRYEHSESQRAKLEVMIEQLKTESAELVERIHITVKERDEIKEQHGKKELQTEEDVMGVVREKDKELKDMKMEMNELQRKYDEKEREIDQMRHIVEEKEEKMSASLQKYEEDQKQREEEWKEKYEKMQEEMEEVKQMDEEKRKVRETEIDSVLEEKETMINELKQKNEESERNLVCLEESYENFRLERDGKIEEMKKRYEDYRKEKEEQRKRAEKTEMEMERRNDMQERYIEEMKERNEKKDKEMEIIKQHYEEELSKIQLEMKLKDEEKEREAERSRQILTEREAQLELNDQRISELMDQAQENEKRAKVTEKRLKDELRKKAEELEEKMKEKEKEVEEMREKYEHSESQRAKLEVMIEQLKTESAELVERIHITLKERDEIKKQHGKKELQTDEDVMGVVREKDKELKDMKMEMNELQRKYDEKEREIDKIRHIVEEKEEKMSASLQKYEEEQKQREEEWKEKYEKMQEEMEEVKQMDEEKRKVRETEIDSVLEEKETMINELKQKNEESERKLVCLEESYENIRLERDGKIEEMKKRCEDYRKEKEEQRKRAEKTEMEMENRNDTQKRYIEEMKERNEKKDKEMEIIKQHYEEELSKIQLEMKLKDEENEREAERSRQILTEKEAQLELNDQRISELMDQAQENEKRAKVTEKRLKDELRKKAEELEQKMKEKEKEVEEMRERYEHSESQRAKLEVMIEQLKTESAELVERIHITVKERDEIKEQHGKKELQTDEDVMGVVREKDKELKDMKMEMNELQKKNDEKEREIDKLRHIIEERKKEITVSLQKYEEDQKQREEEWKEKYEKMQEEMEEVKQLDEQKRRVIEEIDSVLEGKEKLINELKQKNEESERNLVCLREEYEKKEREIKEMVKTHEMELNQKESEFYHKLKVTEDQLKELQLRYMGKELKMADIREREEDNKEDITLHYVKEDEISQIQTEMDKVVRHKNKHSITTIHEEEENKVKASQGNTTALHIKAGETEEGVAGVVKEKQEIREDDSDPSEREGQGEVIKQKNEEQEKEVDKPKWKKERHRAKEGSNEKNLNHCGDNERVNDLLPTEEMRERRISKRERKDAQKERRTQNAVTGQRAGCKERSFQKQAKEIRGSGKLRKETELNVPKPFQSVSPNKPAGVIAEGSPEQPPTTVSPTFPLSPGSPSQAYTAFPSFPEYPGLSELRLVLLGESWASNSSAGNSILGEMEAVAEEGAVRRGQAAGRRVSLVEVTGSRWHLGGEAVGDALREAAQCSPGPHAFLLVIPAYLSFTASYGRAVRRHMAALGERAWRHTLVLFTWAEALGESVEQHVLRSEGLRRLVHRCGNRYHTLHSWRNAGQVSLLLEKVEEMVAENRGGFYCWGASEEEENKDEEEAELEEEEEEAEGRVELEKLTEADRTAGERKEWSETKWQEKKSNGEEETRETNEYRIVERLDEFSDSSIERVQEMELEEKMRDQEEDQVLFCNPPTEPQTPVQNHRPPCSLL
ncbi:LOW QUALITY PROTEIN: trichohyalin [Anguilla anguilla]|uniref:LOW QUALITY PROTEIN: trichohyalin n=1 Tax=Anguilla anguilla TaxID=7936 RepID=UPI0015B292E8|nr:LOW QUALITY PROTEIN: trichohyalin [Anguilla anguilla]